MPQGPRPRRKGFACSLEQVDDDLVGDERGDVGDHGHVCKLHGRELPAIGLAADYGESRRTLHRERKEDDQGDGSAEGHVVAQSGLQAERVRGGVDSVERAQGTDDNLARDDGTEQPIPD